jgi:orotidine-5'-phosphate decarboxylase
MEGSLNQIHRATELIVALDFPRPDRAFELVDMLQGLPVTYKVGLELFMNGGPEVVRELVHRKNRVFLDLKLHDIPNTVARAAKQAALLHVDMMTIHLAGGSHMIRAVTEELQDIPMLRPKIIGVSVLTSFDDVRWAEVTKAMTGHAVDVSESACGMADDASTWGIDGIVCSALELPEIKRLNPGLFAVVPGIRPEGTATYDQARVTTPARARQLGADAVVMGRPITGSPNPRGVVELAIRDLSVSRAS